MKNCDPQECSVFPRAPGKTFPHFRDPALTPNQQWCRVYEWTDKSLAAYRGEPGLSFSVQVAGGPMEFVLIGPRDWAVARRGIADAGTIFVATARAVQKTACSPSLDDLFQSYPRTRTLKPVVYARVEVVDPWVEAHPHPRPTAARPRPNHLSWWTRRTNVCRTTSSLKPLEKPH